MKKLQIWIKEVIVEFIFLFVNKLSENCNFSTIMAKTLEIYSEKGIKDIGYNIIIIMLMSILIQKYC